MPAEIHVVPLEDGGWCLRTDPHGNDLSTHHDATEAARCAVAPARGATRVVLHDRYGRTRTTIPRERGAHA